MPAQFPATEHLELLSTESDSLVFPDQHSLSLPDSHSLGSQAEKSVFPLPTPGDWRSFTCEFLGMLRWHLMASLTVPLLVFQHDTCHHPSTLLFCGLQRTNRSVSTQSTETSLVSNMPAVSLLGHSADIAVFQHLALIRSSQGETGEHTWFSGLGGYCEVLN